MDRPEMPAGLSLTRATQELTALTAPAALLSAHRVADGVWGRLKVHKGSLRFVFEGHADEPLIITAGEHVDIPPGRLHHIEPADDAIFLVEFHR